MSSASSFSDDSSPNRPSFAPPSSSVGVNPNPSANLEGKLFYISDTEYIARILDPFLYRYSIDVELINLTDYDPHDLQNESLVVFVTSSLENGKPPGPAEYVAHWLSWKANDPSGGSSMLLERCRFAVFGVGSRRYGNDFGHDIVQWMTSLGASRIGPFGKGCADSKQFRSIFMTWSFNLVLQLKGKELSIENLNAAEELRKGEGAYIVFCSKASALKESPEDDMPFLEESRASSDNCDMQYEFYSSRTVIDSEEEVDFLKKPERDHNVKKEILSQMAPANPEKQTDEARRFGKLASSSRRRENLNFKKKYYLLL